MANPHLVTYIRNGLNQGYRADVLRNYLIQQGYNQADVDAAVMAAYHGEQPDKKKFLAFVAVVLILFIGGGIFAYMHFFKAPEGAGLDVGTSTKSSQSTFSNSATKSSGVPTKGSQQTTQNIGGSVAKSSTSTEQFVSSPKILGASVASPDEELEELMKEIRSVNDCETLTEQRDRCVLEYSWLKDHVNFCEDIGTVALKDECYSRYSLRHEDKTYCQQIENKYTREICDILLRTATMLRDQGTKYTLDPIEAKITYNQQEAIANLQKNAQEKFGDSPQSAQAVQQQAQQQSQSNQNTPSTAQNATQNSSNQQNVNAVQQSNSLVSQQNNQQQQQQQNNTLVTVN